MHNKALEEQMYEQSKKLWKMEIVNKGLTDYMNHNEIQKKEEDRNQRLKRDQRQLEGSYEVRKKELKNEGQNIERRSA